MKEEIEIVIVGETHLENTFFGMMYWTEYFTDTKYFTREECREIILRYLDFVEKSIAWYEQKYFEEYKNFYFLKEYSEEGRQREIKEAESGLRIADPKKRLIRELVGRQEAKRFLKAVGDFMNLYRRMLYRATPFFTEEIRLLIHSREDRKAEELAAQILLKIVKDEVEAGRKKILIATGLAHAPYFKERLEAEGYHIKEIVQFPKNFEDIYIAMESEIRERVPEGDYGASEFIL